MPNFIYIFFIILAVRIITLFLPKNVTYHIMAIIRFLSFFIRFRVFLMLKQSNPRLSGIFMVGFIWDLIFFSYGYLYREQLKENKTIIYWNIPGIILQIGSVLYFTFFCKKILG